jgi:branched-chain amino acid transport system ATP-binding protein
MSVDNTDDSATELDRTYSPDDGLLVLQNLTKEFGGLTAVDDLSFHVEEGEILGFIGPNGAGKSTTFNCVTKMYPATAGTVWYDGEDITDLPAHKIVGRGINRTFQSFRPLNDRTVLENVMLPLSTDKVLTLDGLFGRTEDRAIELCEQVGLGDRTHMEPGELPHAEMIRLELGRALATDPELILIDEPFAGLTSTEIEELSKLFKELRDDGHTLVVIDHNMRGLLTLVDRVIVIRFGSKIAEGPPEEIKQNEEVQNAYLGSQG